MAGSLAPRIRLNATAAPQGPATVAPAAPRATMAQPGPANAMLVARLNAVKARFQMLSQENYSTARPEEPYDMAILPALAAAENARNPGLNLNVLKPGPRCLADFLMHTKEPNPRVVLPLGPGNFHFIAADIQRINGRTSVIAVEPLGMDPGYTDYWKDNYLPALKAQLGRDVQLTVLSLSTQISDSNCMMYSLTHALKMQDHAAMFKALHQQNLSGAPLKTSTGSNAHEPLTDENLRVVDGTGVLPPEFFKHAQSRRTVQGWLGANPPAFQNASVNKLGQTLSDRYDSHATTRWKKPEQAWYAQTLGLNPPAKSISTNPSIEEKRLTFIDRAIAHFSQAPNSQAENMLANLDGVDLTHADMRRPWANWEREWGPQLGIPPQQT